MTLTMSELHGQRKEGTSKSAVDEAEAWFVLYNLDEHRRTSIDTLFFCFLLRT